MGAIRWLKGTRARIWDSTLGEDSLLGAGSNGVQCFFR